VFDHVTLRASDREASERFFDTVLPVVGLVKSSSDDWVAEWGDFSISPANEEKPPTRGLHIAFAAPSREHVDAFWQAGVDAGYRDDGEPGPRPQYRYDYYGGFLRDPDGNSIEAVHDSALPPDGGIDHMWIRVADVEASARFYAAVMPHAGYVRGHEEHGFQQFRGNPRSFSVVHDTPVTERLHMAFPAPDNAAVDAFHRDLVAAGYRDNGAPGERAIYHPGYYGAFVLDPDGNNVELVCHNR
jgi:catechol 2,3-dioxygenase-like lactoylglutathione lyase family enzyme